MPKTFNRDIELGGTSKITKNGSTIISATGAVTLTADAIPSASVTRTKMSTPAALKHDNKVMSTITTTGNTDTYFLVPAPGTVTGVFFNGADALAAHDTNYVTFSLVNQGQAGAGTTDVLAVSDSNTTKATGGSAIAATTLRTFQLIGTAANLNVTTGDRLRFRAAASGTLANTVSLPLVLITYGGTT